jgi:outer membrane protein OmpA-like peptidoglycan-associated protein
MKTKILLLLMLYTTLSIAQEGLVGEYYNGINFEQKVLTRTDAKIDFYWAGGVSPDKGVNKSYYSIRWTGKILAPETGKYLFSAKVDDGLRLWVNNVPLINAWEWQDNGDFSNSVLLEANKVYDIKVEYFNSIIEGEITLLWQLPSQVTSSTYSYNNFKPVSANYLYQPNYNPPPVKTPIIASKNTTPPINKPKPEIRNPKPPTPTPIPSPSSTVSKEKVVEKPTSTFEKMDKNLDVKQVFFIRSINKMTDNSIERLDKVVDFLKNKATAKIELNGHTDVMGDAQKNMELSISRAKGVSDYLISKGISENRISYQGFGGTQPLISDPKTEEERAVNRRVEFIFKN